QYVSKLLKGQENLSIQTIAKLEEALDIDIIAGTLAPVSGYSISYSENPVYLSEPDIPEYGSR
ncbi:MAG: helix-turn-helix transcriptional regulator, partial [Bacteroidales bacterium]|nr:helix-turn-helix transcriptional regulator [Bacteroidales bacterium]